MSEPNSCVWCGTPERQHASRYTDGIGLHRYIAPTNEVRLARMRDRHVAALHDLTPQHPEREASE